MTAPRWDRYESESVPDIGHRAVVGKLGVAPPTASEHLQKAEVRLIDAALDEFGPEM